MKLDTGQAWTEAMALLKAQREILLTLAGVFFLLPSLLLATFAPFEMPPEATGPQVLAAYQAWTAEHWPWLLFTTLAALLGRLAILVLLLAPERPTVAQALAVGAAMLIVAFVLNVLISLIVGAGMLVLIVPGLYLIGRTFLAEAALVGERLRGPIAPIGRSFAISRGNGWRIFFALAVVFLGVQLVGLVAGWIVAIVARLTVGIGAMSVASNLVSALSNTAMSLLLLLMTVAIWRQLAGANR